MLLRMLPLVALPLLIACSAGADVEPARLDIVDQHGARSEAASFDELAEALGFEIALPDRLPAGYSYDWLSALIHVGDGADFQPPPGAGSSLQGVLRGDSPTESVMISVHLTASVDSAPGEPAELGGVAG